MIIRPLARFVAPPVGSSLVLALALAPRPAAAESFKVEVPAIQKGKIGDKNVFEGMGCTGGNTSPEVKWSGAPKDTAAFAVTVYDPDAPTGSGWWHWVVYNIPKDVTSLAEGAGSNLTPLPKGAAQGRTDFGKPGYGGPCPPPGKPHRYIFKVFALKAPIEVPADASPAMIGFNLNQSKLAEASVTGKYGR